MIVTGFNIIFHHPCEHYLPSSLSAYGRHVSTQTAVTFVDDDDDGDDDVRSICRRQKVLRDKVQTFFGVCRLMPIGHSHHMITKIYCRELTDFESSLFPGERYVGGATAAVPASLVRQRHVSTCMVIYTSLLHSLGLDVFYLYNY